MESATRDDSDGNYFYFPTRQDIQDDLEHFQMHWSKGQHVIVRNVLQNKSDLNWDPLFMFHKFHEGGVAESKNDTEVKALDCLDWCEVEICLQPFLQGYLKGRTHSNLWPEMLRLKDWPSPEWFQEQFAAYNLEFLHALPFQEYINPYSGILNLACRTP